MTQDSVRSLLFEVRLHELAGGSVVDERALAALLYGGLAAAADCEALTIRTLRRRIRAAGMTASEMVRTARARLSLHLLRGKQPIGAVSSAIGYRSPRCFSRFIKSEFGITPRELRRKLRDASDQYPAPILTLDAFGSPPSRERSAPRSVSCAGHPPRPSRTALR